MNSNGTIDAKAAVSIATTFQGGNALLLVDGAATRPLVLPVGAAFPPLVVNAPNVTVTTSGSGLITFGNTVNFQNAASVIRAEERRAVKDSCPLSTGFKQETGDLIFNNTYTQTAGTFTPSTAGQ